jgi:hypothetical protein
MVRPNRKRQETEVNVQETTEIRELTVGDIEIVAGGGEYGPFANEPPKTGLTDVVSAVVETVVKTVAAVVRAVPL